MNQKMMNSILGVLFVVVFFVLSSYYVQNNIDYVKSWIGTPFGIFAYIGIVVIAEVIAPVSALPFLPLASASWGWFWAAIFSIIGWTIGGIIAFEIARVYGIPLVKRFVSLDDIHSIEKRIPQGNLFWSIVFLRMVIPVDVLSYAIGLFSNISRKKYILATVIGITPFGFIFAYLGTMPIVYQIIGLLLAGGIIVIGYFIENRKRKGVENT